MIVVLDIDKTLIDPGGVEGDSCRSFIDSLVAAGDTIVLASARSLPSMWAGVPYALAQATFAICSDGAVTAGRSYPGAPMEVVRVVALDDAAAAASLAGAFRMNNPSCSVFAFLGPGMSYNVWVTLSRDHRGSLDRILNGRPYSEPLSSEAPECLSVAVLGSKTIVRSFQDHVPERVDWILRVYEEVRSLSGDLWWSEITSRHADKSEALAWLAASQSPRLPSDSPVLFVGDGKNDTSVAALADVVVCPQWADAAMLALANVVGLGADCATFLDDLRARMPEFRGQGR